MPNTYSAENFIKSSIQQITFKSGTKLADEIASFLFFCELQGMDHSGFIAKEMDYIISQRFNQMINDIDEIKIS